MSELKETLIQIKLLNSSLITENDELKNKLKYKEEIEKIIMDQLNEIKERYEDIAEIYKAKEQENEDLKEMLNKKDQDKRFYEIIPGENIRKEIENLSYVKSENSSPDIRSSCKTIKTYQSSHILNQTVNVVSKSQKIINRKGQQELIMPFLSGNFSR